MRYAVYFTPPQDDPLALTAARWLGRDAFTGQPVARPDLAGVTREELAYFTASARRYGFHATLKAPFELAAGETEAGLLRAFDSFVATVEPVRVPAVQLSQIDRFFALTPAEPSTALNRLASDVVIAFDRFRAPLSDADIERRNPESLKPVELKYLHQWGYPYVFEAFRFHMTLSGQVPAAESPRFRAAIEEIFGPLASGPLDVGSIALFVEPEPGAPFGVLAHRALGRLPQRKIA
jgi:putative phosphonate metabolism protein